MASAAVCERSSSRSTSKRTSAPRSSRSSLTGAAILEDGVLAGLIGAVVVAIWFLILDSFHGAPFATPSLLGRAVFLGGSAESVATDPILVFAYTGMHGLLFLIAGATLAWMVMQFEKNPQFGVVLGLLFLLFEAVIFGLEVTVVPQLVGALGSWAVMIANLLSAVAMFWFLLRRRPEALSRLKARGTSEPRVRGGGRCRESKHCRPALKNLERVENLIRLLDSRSFSNTNTGPYYSSVGGHLRHILDVFACIVRGADSGVVDLTDRRRGTLAERGS